MLENYFIKGLVIGIVFGVPAGAVGVLSVKRALTRGSVCRADDGNGFLSGGCILCVGRYIWNYHGFGFPAETSKNHLYGGLSYGSRNRNPNAQEKRREVSRSICFGRKSNGGSWETAPAHNLLFPVVLYNCNRQSGSDSILYGGIFHVSDRRH